MSFSPMTVDGAFLLPDHLRCTYRSKACPNERARKRNGTVHKLCQAHRVKANINQRNMQKRIRARKQLELESSGSTSSGSGSGSGSDSSRSSMDGSGSGSDDDLNDWILGDLEPLCEPVELTPEDLEALQLLWDQTMPTPAPVLPMASKPLPQQPSRTHCAVF